MHNIAFHFSVKKVFIKLPIIINNTRQTADTAKPPKITKRKTQHWSYKKKPTPISNNNKKKENMYVAINICVVFIFCVRQPNLNSFHRCI